MAIQHNTRQTTQIMIEPCPFKVGDLVRVKDMGLDGNVGTVVADHQIIRVSRDLFESGPRMARKLGTLMHIDIDKDVAIMRAPRALVTWWSDPYKSHAYYYHLLEKVEP